MKKSKLLSLISVLMIMVLTLVSCGTTKDKSQGYQSTYKDKIK